MCVCAVVDILNAGFHTGYFTKGEGEGGVQVNVINRTPPSLGGLRDMPLQKKGFEI